MLAEQAYDLSDTGLSRPLDVCRIGRSQSGAHDLRILFQSISPAIIITDTISTPWMT
jgi:hypothetical protein